MYKLKVNKILFTLFIFTILTIIIFIYPLQGTSYNSNIITHQIDLIAGCNECFHDEIHNDRNYPIIITEFIHTGTPDLDGITISIHEIEQKNSDYIPGDEMELPITVESGETFHFFICYDTNIALKPDTYLLETLFILHAPEAILYAGQNIDVGTITIWNDAYNIYLSYYLNDNTIFIVMKRI